MSKLIDNRVSGINPPTAVGKQCGRIAVFTGAGTLVLGQLFPFYRNHLLHSHSRIYHFLHGRDTTDTQWWMLLIQGSTH